MFSVLVTVDNRPIRLQLCDTAGQVSISIGHTQCTRFSHLKDLDFRNSQEMLHIVSNIRIYFGVLLDRDLSKCMLHLFATMTNELRSMRTYV